MRVDSPSSGYGRRSVAPQKRTLGFQSRSSGRSLAPGAGASRSSSAARRDRCPGAAPESIEEQVDRPLVADVAESTDRRSRDHRIRVVEDGPDQPRDCGVMLLLESLERRNATPPPPLGSRPPSRPPDESLGRAGTQRLGRRPACTVMAESADDRSPVTARASSQTRVRARQEQREGRARPPFVVVVPGSSDVPRTRDPPELAVVATIGSGDATHGAIGADLRASRAVGGAGRGRGSRMRMRGLEPPRPYGHTDLNRARLPIPPHPRGRTILASSRLTPR